MSWKCIPLLWQWCATTFAVAWHRCGWVLWLHSWLLVTLWKFGFGQSNHADQDADFLKWPGSLHSLFLLPRVCCFFIIVAFFAIVCKIPALFYIKRTSNVNTSIWWGIFSTYVCLYKEIVLMLEKLNNFTYSLSFMF